jgi:hypothetical protein
MQASTSAILAPLLSRAVIGGYYKCGEEQSYINFKETRPFVGDLNFKWREDSIVCSSEVLWSHRQQIFLTASLGLYRGEGQGSNQGSFTLRQE